MSVSVCEPSGPFLSAFCSWCPSVDVKIEGLRGFSSDSADGLLGVVQCGLEGPLGFGPSDTLKNLDESQSNLRVRRAQDLFDV